MDIKPGEITDILKREIKEYGREIDVAETGTVLSYGDGIARVYGLSNAVAGEQLEFANGQFGQALNLDENSVGVVIFGDYFDIKEGSEVRRTGELLSIPCGEPMVGRIVDPLGRPLDGKGAIETPHRRPLEFKAPGISARQPVNEPLQTGIKPIDAMIPIGRGQRELIIGDRQTGKTTLLRRAYPDAWWIDLLKSEEYRRYLQKPELLRQELAEEDPGLQRQIVIDEVQKVPKILDEVHWLHEAHGLQFALCGSSARKVKRGAANLLDGRAVGLPEEYSEQSRTIASGARRIECNLDDVTGETLVTSPGVVQDVAVIGDYVVGAAAGQGVRASDARETADMVLTYIDGETLNLINGRFNAQIARRSFHKLLFVRHRCLASSNFGNRIVCGGDEADRGRAFTDRPIPARIAVLLPLSGNLAGPAEAIRDGIVVVEKNGVIPDGTVI